MRSLTSSLPQIAVQAQSADKTLRQIQVPALIETYSLVLQGQQKIFKYDKQQNIEARKMYQKALEAESDYSRAMAALSRTHNLNGVIHGPKIPSLHSKKRMN